MRPRDGGGRGPGQGKSREGKLGEAVGTVPPGAAPGPPGFLW